MKNEWEPTYENWNEGKVEMADFEISTYSSSHRDFGVSINGPEHPYEGNGAIFWIDRLRLYLRYDWGTWYRISPDDHGNCEKICRSSYAKLQLCRGTSLTTHPVKVYHLDRLPEELFGRNERESGQQPPAADSDDTMDSDELDMAAYVTGLVCCFGGEPIAESIGNQYPSAFYELNGHFLCVNFFEHDGDWLADEDWATSQGWPSWYGEESMAVSPFAAVVLMREKLAKILPDDVPFHSIVVLNQGCKVINESDHLAAWRAKDVHFARQYEVYGSGITSAYKLVDSISGDSRPDLKSYASPIADVLAEFPFCNPNA